MCNACMQVMTFRQYDPSDSLCAKRSLVPLAGRMTPSGKD
jgi:hypothetical protein